MFMSVEHLLSAPFCLTSTLSILNPHNQWLSPVALAIFLLPTPLLTAITLILTLITSITAILSSEVAQFPIPPLDHFTTSWWGCFPNGQL